MSGTVKTDSALLAEFADGQAAGSITPQDVRDVIVSIPSLAPVQSVSGRTGTVTLTHTDVTDLNTLNGGPGVVFIKSSNAASIKSNPIFPPFAVNNATAGMSFSFVMPFDAQIQGMWVGLVVGGGSCPFTVNVTTNVVNTFNGTPTLTGTGVTAYSMSAWWSVTSGQYITITLGTVTGTITSGFIQLAGVYQ